MEDSEYAIFKKEEKQVIYKQILQLWEVEELNNYFVQLKESEPFLFYSNETLASGKRTYCDINLSDEPFSFLSERLIVVLNDYSIDKIDRHARFYCHSFGGVKPHIDSNHDNMSNYTLLLYLNDDFEGGELSIKMKRSEEECILSEPDKHHKVFKIRPTRGYGVIFDKSLLHWAEETYKDKNFLLIHLYSNLI